MWRCEVLNLSVASLETLNTSSSIDKLLFAGKKRMTGGADLGVDLLAGRAGLETVATQALHSGIRIHWVDTFFHFFLLHIGAALCTVHSLTINTSDSGFFLQPIF